MYKSFRSSFVIVTSAVILVGRSGGEACQHSDVDAICEAQDAWPAPSLVQRRLSFNANARSLQVVSKNTTSDVLWHSASMNAAVLPQKQAQSMSLTEHLNSKKEMQLYGFAAVIIAALITIAGFLLQSANARVVEVGMAICSGGIYIFVSALMIETNNWLMHKDRFPYPVMLTTNHMLASCVLSNALRVVHPTSFPALQRIAVTPTFCWKFLGIGVPCAVSLLCGNWAYKYLTVSFLQIIKESNIGTIYILSVIAGLEALRRCSVVLLAGVMIGAIMAVQGELHFVLAGFLLQACSSVCEAVTVIAQSVLMRREMKLDPLTMVLFVAPACFLANLVPLAALEGSQLALIFSQFFVLWPILLGNACLAFVLNVAVAQCIKQLSAVGYCLCGIVRNILVIVTSTWFLGERLAPLQTIGFSIALTSAALFSIYKQNIDMFGEDNLVDGFIKLIHGQGAKEMGNPQDRGNQNVQDDATKNETPVIDSNKEK